MPSQSLILRATTPLLVSLMIVFSLWVLFRGHNHPGGGFIGGLIAASAFALLGLASGTEAVRKALRVAPLAVAGTGLFLSTASGIASAYFRDPFLTGQWYTPMLGDIKIPVATPVVFDIGVYLVVVGSLIAILLVLAEWDQREP